MYSGAYAADNSTSNSGEHGSLRAYSAAAVGSYSPRILAGMCHAAVVISRQNVKIRKHHILVDRTTHEKSRVRCVPEDATDELRGPDQHCRHVGATFGWPSIWRAIEGCADGRLYNSLQALLRCSYASQVIRMCLAHQLPPCGSTTRMATGSQGSQKDCSEMAKGLKKEGQRYAEGTSMN